MSSDTQTPASKKWTPGLLAGIGIMVGIGTSLAAGVSLIGVATGVGLSIGAGGGQMTALPDTVGGALLLGGVGVAIAAASAAGSWFTHALGAASWPARVAMVVAAVLILGVGGRFVQLKVLEATYGSKAAWYAADGDIPALTEELAAVQDAGIVEDVLFRGLQYDNAEVVGLALDHGANPLKEWGPGDTSCLLKETTQAVQAAAAARGWGADCTRTQPAQ